MGQQPDTMVITGCSNGFFANSVGKLSDSIMTKFPAYRQAGKHPRTRAMRGRQ